MIRPMISAAALAASALLSGCASGFFPPPNEDEALSLCPGGSHCPSGVDYAGMMMQVDSFTAMRPAARAVRLAAAGTAATDAVAAQPDPDPKEERKLCPHNGKDKCGANGSGMQWKAPPHQITCNGNGCVDRKGDPVTNLPLSNVGRPVGVGYVGWLCDKREGDCRDLPQRR